MKLQLMKHGTFFITLPKQIVLAKGWKKGQELKCKINQDGQIIIKE